MVEAKPKEKKKKNLSQDTIREKIYDKGVSNLSEAELLSVILSSGSTEKDSLALAQEILKFCENKIGNLARLSLADLKKFHGVGEAKATMILSSLELGRRKVMQKITKSDTYKTAESIYELIKIELDDKLYEEFWVIMLNNSYRLIRKVCISTGGILGTSVDPRLVFKAAIESAAVRIVLVHNHPSGNVFPSESDIDLTRRIVEASKVVDVRVADHVIVSSFSYFSFAEDNLIFHRPMF